MKRLKPLLPFADSTFLETHIKNFSRIGVEDILVVVGFKRERLIPVLQNYNVGIIENDEFMSGMYSSIQKGVINLKKEIEAFFLMPCDIPVADEKILEDLKNKYTKCAKGILIPCYQGKKGHPPIISTAYARHIVQRNPNRGLREILHEFVHDTIFMNVDHEYIILDVNTPEQYDDIQKYG